MSWRSLVLGLALALVVGCGRGGSAGQEQSNVGGRVPVHVFEDTGRSVTLTAPPPSARVSFARVSVAPVTRPGTAALSPPLPAAAPDTALPESPAAAAVTDDALRAPIPRAPGSLVVPRGWHGRGLVELDVRVDELGRVTDVRWAAGARDSALVLAAERCAAQMSFYAAELHGEPIAVWCRQRFEFDSH